jgi:D-alanine-D-alanine ligase
MAERLRVAVLFGGRSGEHEVSLMSAQSVLAALDPAKYEVVGVGITKEGRWLAGPSAIAALRAAVENQRALEPPASEAIPLPSPGTVVAAGDRGVASTEQALSWLGGPVDVVFPVLHGPYGEDGTVQGLLELVDVPYVGCGVAASAVGMDKVLMKRLLRDAGLPIASFAVVMRRVWQREPERILAELEARFGYPCFVKPANLGSSVGVSKVYDRAGLAQALDLAAEHDRKLVVEEFIAGREIECSVLGNDEPEASVPGEVIPARDFYDYEAKYFDEGTRLIIPASLPPQVEATVRQYAVDAFRALDCAGLARVDFFVTPDDRVYVNEVNTIPGFTSMSMYPKLWEASGLSYPALVDRLITLALERHRERARASTVQAGSTRP